MKSLMLDTSWKQLVIILLEDGQVKASLVEEAFKRQSESLFVELKRLLGETGWKLKDLDEVIITDGPGSYTGLRIAMTTAKLLGTQADIQVKTLSTFQLYAGAAPLANVILDARGGRVYAAHLENGKPTWMGILPLEQVECFLKDNPGELYGEGWLIDKQASPSDFVENIRLLLPVAETVENVHGLIPRYMKESDSYKV
ncbi:tRNA (adenosine(37)-N6)-threonylcarbamoyltransferase complex dimerization subunit type 1 TsaB [Allobaculum sp. JKK-2023]|uniref:tRNA (adenosine(37)-N6)-threonylcarbamoyltransferase complex dimerization subunit type 1 TsaB n=1 Tax=Allobaculum sp. JKK-2023 TaxID=3108943 RepID=UPI002B05F43E|nr:tRNA (adenosine(37)-N6)-threonylcarbamoyltransferase complex dimerization subunit type 1 TsaB [Allobaculum sp. JKK-2023]